MHDSVSLAMWELISLYESSLSVPFSKELKVG